MWHCQVVWAQVLWPTWLLPKRLPWLMAPTSAAACGPHAGAARGSKPGRQQYRHRVLGTGILRGRVLQDLAWEHGAQPFHAKREPPLLGHPVTRVPGEGFSTPIWRSADFPRSTSISDAASSNAESVGLALLLPPLRLRGAGGGCGSRLAVSLPGQAMAPLRPLPQRELAAVGGADAVGLTPSQAAWGNS